MLDVKHWIQHANNCRHSASSTFVITVFITNMPDETLMQTMSTAQRMAYRIGRVLSFTTIT